ncbi:hypothetical protein T05_10906 [Trichinella murrelli]|uniref:Uncharacterized protein n=1 Tax=Trichinella murrelli TaxID=144512 RepID=A0A0V0TWT0_9BILA|nr:hypothetical protein T05_10906 [Trichinella murrelli]
MFPKETRECTYGEINDIFELLYQSKVTVFTARKEFGKINTQYGETITKSISRLKEACAKCNLGVDPEANQMSSGLPLKNTRGVDYTEGKFIKCYMKDNLA